MLASQKHGSPVHLEMQVAHREIAEADAQVAMIHAFLAGESHGQAIEGGMVFIPALHPLAHFKPHLRHAIRPADDIVVGLFHSV